MATKTRQLADFLLEGGVQDIAVQQNPHIQPGILQPALAGKLLDNSTSHSGDYGTAQSDGHSYYYTDIKGSKPIKDPRIGAHFGSQRHKFKSIQKLEQETATHGKDVYSVDGREWLRIVDVTGGGWVAENAASGCGLNIGSDKEGWIEVVGYFNAVNLIMRTYATRKSITPYINGVAGSTQNPSETSVSSPLLGRYVDAGSLVSLTISASLGINTLLIKDNIESSNYTNYHQGIELIAQDTTSTATKSQIQIPSQNVVSYGKKFTVSGTPHYDPFNGFTNGTTLHSAVVDTATSLGLSTAPGSSASWAISGTNNIRPYNGGRVVKWVASDGTIKTSVNMMPPNAQNILGTVAGTTEVTTPSATNTTPTPIFSDDAVDHSLSEVAKTYHWREFGNGSANHGTGHANYADFSMHINNDSTEDNMFYAMDDGLTLLTGLGNHTNSENITSGGNAKGFYFTFIGTGITLKTTSGGAGTRTMALNLPYGTHIYKHYRDGGATPDGTIDGVALADIAGDTYSAWDEVTFHQPKMPPIPEDAVIISDYMLMADFVASTVSNTTGTISKGVRFVSGTRDAFYDSGAAITYNSGYTNSPYGVSLYNTNANSESRIVAFGSAFGQHYLKSTNREANVMARLDGSNFTYNASNIYDTDGEWDDANDDGTLSKDGTEAWNVWGIKNQDLGIHTFGDKKTSGSDYNAWGGYEIASPIHSSSHYQSFETPYLHELVGGDRNMEQNNLIVTPDGKTWDEVTRDVSYIGNNRFNGVSGSDDSNSTQVFFPDDLRGMHGTRSLGNKDFAIGYDRLICLVGGQYIVGQRGRATAVASAEIKINGTLCLQQSCGGTGSNSETFAHEVVVELERGDYITWNSPYNSGHYGDWWVRKI